MKTEIKNLKKLANRILKAIQNKEKIILYGDADLDGVTAVIILKETIRNLGGKISAIYFPDREIEGYGISEIGLNYLKIELSKKAKIKKRMKFSSPPELSKKASALLITLDCGIGNFQEVKLAQKFSFEVIIIDHHQILDRLPQAKIIVNPHQKGDEYPFKPLATAGIVFKLSQILLKDFFTENLRKNFLELVALATLADMMPPKSENKIFIEQGLKSLPTSWRPGIKALFETRELNHYLNLNQKVSKIISLLNVRDVKDNFPASFRLLTVPCLKDGKKLVKRLWEKSLQRKEKIEKIIQEIERRLSGSKELIIFEGDSSFDFTFISPVASKFCQKYQKPTFIFKKLEKESQGTVRTPSGIDSVELMKKCKKYLITYGGHPRASGFRIKNENLEKFKKCLIKNYAN